MDLASAASFAGGATGILFFRRHYAYMEPRLILITKWHVRPDRGEQHCDDSIPVPDFPGFNVPGVTAAG
jgi:hypothetical protein